MSSPSSQPDRFRPEMPHIPGVSDQPPREGAGMPVPTRFMIVAAALVLLGILAWGGLRAARNRSRTKTGTDASVDASLPQVASDEVAPDSGPQFNPDVKEVAKLAELASPWSAKNFTFNNPVTHEAVPALIVRLPGGAADHSASYWAFSLRAPYESCDLQYVTDVGMLAARYSYRASHPMVLAACDGTIYDPLKMGTSPSGAWVRGEIVQGVGIRPPLAIEIRVQGDTIIADNME